MLRVPDTGCKLASQRCPACGARGDFVSWGSYKRNLVELIFGIPVDTVLKVKRVMCRSCAVTHALIPFDVVPYCQHSTTLSARLFEMKYAGGHTVEEICHILALSQTTFYRIYRRSLGRLLILVPAQTFLEAFITLFNDVSSLVDRHLCVHRIKPFESGRLPPAFFDT